MLQADLRFYGVTYCCSSRPWSWGLPTYLGFQLTPLIH